MRNKTRCPQSLPPRWRRSRFSDEELTNAQTSGLGCLQRERNSSHGRRRCGQPQTARPVLHGEAAATPPSRSGQQSGAPRNWREPARCNRPRAHLQTAGRAPQTCPRTCPALQGDQCWMASRVNSQGSLVWPTRSGASAAAAPSWWPGSKRARAGKLSALGTTRGARVPNLGMRLALRRPCSAHSANCSSAKGTSATHWCICRARGNKRAQQGATPSPQATGVRAVCAHSATYGRGASRALKRRWPADCWTARTSSCCRHHAQRRASTCGQPLGRSPAGSRTECSTRVSAKCATYE